MTTETEATRAKRIQAGVTTAGRWLPVNVEDEEGGHADHHQ
ncbi:MAG: hypothetical protein U0232_25605 [Thermomicrobiales bacterium]